MTDETKKLFDAPWSVVSGEQYEPYDVENKSGDSVIDGFNQKEMFRIARLPDLYDALVEAAENYCGICHNLSGQNEPKIEDLIKNGCPKKRALCKAIKWLDLLRKVRGRGVNKSWTPWKLLIHVQLSSYDPNLEESVREAAELLSFIHKATSSVKRTRTIVDLCYNCIWPDFDALHLLVQRIKCRFDNLAEFDLCIYRAGRTRRLIWEHNNYMSVYDATLKLPVSTVSAAQYRSTLLAAWEASDYVDKVRSMWIDKDIQYPRRPRRYGFCYDGYDPDYSPEDMDPYILEAGPFDAGW